MSIKRNLKPKIRRTRGGHCSNALLAAVDDMSEQAAQELWNLLRNLEDDAKRDGARDGARQPWKHGVFR